MFYKSLLTLLLALIATTTASPLDSIDFTKDELTYIKKIQESGSLRIATRISKTVYEPQGDGTIGGIWYLLIENFAKFINVSIKTTIVTSMNDFFLKDGVIPEGLKSGEVAPYMPDLLKNVDIYIYTIAQLPWRKKVLQFIDICPNKIMSVTRKGEEFSSFKELDGKIVSVEKNSSPYTQFKECEIKYSISLKYLNKIGKERLQAVSTGEADVSAMGANRAISEIKSYDNLSISIPISEQQTLGWAVEKDNSTLASIVSKFISYSHKTGAFNQIWKEYYGMNYTTYLQMLNYK